MFGGRRRNSLSLHLFCIGLLRIRGSEARVSAKSTTGAKALNCVINFPLVLLVFRLSQQSGKQLLLSPNSGFGQFFVSYTNKQGSNAKGSLRHNLSFMQSLRIPLDLAQNKDIISESGISMQQKNFNQLQNPILSCDSNNIIVPQLLK